MLRFIKGILPVAALCLLLAACGGKTPKAYDPAATADALKGSTAFSEGLEVWEKETAATYYGIDVDTIQDCAVYGSLSAGAEEIAVLTLTDETTAQSALEALKSHVEDQKEALKDYQPDEVSKLDNAITDQRGNSALLVVAKDAAAAQTVLDQLK